MAAYDALASVRMGRISSDDVRLISAISEFTTVFYHPDVKITHFIRETLAENFLHLIYRGSTFVQYYLDPSKRLFWVVLVLPVLSILLFGAGMILTGASWHIPILLILAHDLIVAIYLGLGIRDKMAIALMLPICEVTFFGCGARDLSQDILLILYLHHLQIQDQQMTFRFIQHKLNRIP